MVGALLVSRFRLDEDAYAHIRAELRARESRR
jgi:Na+/melibiose symporter-like transporter